MDLPFTHDEFLGVFAEYNRTFWYVAVALWVVSGAVLARAWRERARANRILSGLLAALWLWNALAYHVLFFTRINPAAWLFSALFALQAALFARAAARDDVHYFSQAVGWRWLGAGFAVYALAYPLLAIAFVSPYPATPTFGVPCPTATLTIGVLLTAGERLPVSLAIVPIAWSMIGGSAAVLLAVPTDFVLLAAGVLATAFLLLTRRRRSLVAH